MRHHNLRKNLLRSSGLAAALAVLAGPALAQTQREPDEDDQEVVTEVEEVVVVGSRLRQDVYTSPSPIQVITRDESTMAGFNTTTGALQSTAVTGGSGQINNIYGQFVTDGGPGANTLGLRGLGPSRTLILLNGRRVAPAGSRGAIGSTDLNVLPNAMIERIDILRDGASSIYGSDAIAGVVNIVTRRDVDGVDLEAQVTIPEHGGGEDARFSLVTGTRGDRWRLAGSIEHYDRSVLRLADRDWARCNVQGLRDPETGESLDYIDPLTGAPRCYPIGLTGSNGVTINTIATPFITTPDYGGLLPLFGGGATAPGLFAAVNAGVGQAQFFNRFRPNAAVTTGVIGFEGVDGFYLNDAGTSLFGLNDNIRDTFEPRMLEEAIFDPIETTTVYGEGQFDLRALGDAELFFEVLGNRRTSKQTSYRQLLIDYPFGSPFIPENLRFDLPALPAQDGGTTGDDPIGIRAFVGAGTGVNRQEVDFWKGTVGLRGALGADWNYEVYASHARSRAQYVNQAYLIDQMTRSVDLVVAPDGLDDRFVRNGYTCRANLEASPTCIPVPLLNSATIGGELPQDWLDYVDRPVTGRTAYDETIVAGYVDGALFELPAGPLLASLGAEYRRAEIDDTPPLDSQRGNLANLSSAAITRGDDSVWEVFGEVSVPLLRDLAFADQLTLSASARYTDYASYGGDTTYKLGLLYRPVNWLTVRSAYGTSFRAPALFEQFQGATTGFIGAGFDPCDDYSSLDSTTITYQNCDAELGNPNFVQTSGIEVVNAGGAAAGLFAETSSNFSVGVVATPNLGDRFGDLALAIDYYEITIEDAVSQLSASSILNLCYADPEFRSGGGLCRLVSERGASGQLSVLTAYTNIATQVVEGIDYNLRYSRDLGPGSLLANLQVSQFLAQDFRQFEGDAIDRLNGVLGAPELTATADINYSWDRWRVRYAVDWIDAMSSFEYLGIDPATSSQDFAVDEYTLHSASVRYAGDGVTITAGVRNLFDRDPPTVSEGSTRIGNAYLYSGVDYFGRTFFLNVAKSF